MSQKEEVGEKITYEWERFCQSCLCQSKASLFDRSGEIELKKKVNNALQRIVPGREEAHQQLLAADSILEEACRYVNDHLAGGNTVEDLVGRWLGSVATVPYHAMRRGS